MFVMTPVSSRKTSFEASSPGWFSRHSSLAAFTSGLSCSAANRLFFITEPVAVEKAPDGAYAGRKSFVAAQAVDNLLQGHVRLLRDKAEQIILMPVQRGLPACVAGRQLMASR